MSVQWNALMSAPNPGEAFANAYQQGIQQREQREMRQQAMQEHQEDRQFRREQMQQQGQVKALEAHREKIVLGARLIRQVNPQDQAGWDQVRGLAQQAGIDLADVPPQFDPNYVKGLVSIADTFEPQKQENAPTSFDEYQRAQADPNYAKFLEERRGPLIANNGDGTFTLIPRSMGGPQQPQAAPPPPPGFVIDNDGGPTQPASGGFPPSGY